MPGGQRQLWWRTVQLNSCDVLAGESNVEESRYETHLQSHPPGRVGDEGSRRGVSCLEWIRITCGQRSLYDISGWDCMLSYSFGTMLGFRYSVP